MAWSSTTSLSSGTSSPSVWSNTERPPPTSGQSTRRRSVFRSIRMSMSISPGSIPPLPPNSSAHRALTPGQATAHGSPLPPLPPRNIPAVATPTTVPYGIKPPPLPLSSNNATTGSTLQGRPSDPSTPTGSKPSNGPGTKLKQVLANRRAKRSNKSSGNVLDDCTDGEIVSPLTSPSTPTTTTVLRSPKQTQQHNFPIHITSPDRPQALQSEPEGGSSRPNKGSATPRLRLESKIQAFTAGLKRHHAIMSNPPHSPVRPAPPPKPPALRVQPSNSEMRATIILASPQDEDAAQPNRKRLSSKSSDSRISTRSTSRPLTPTMIAAQNVASAASLVPKNVASLAAKVVSSDSRGSLAPVVGASRNSFQMPNSPSISAALSYMQNIPNDEDKDRKKEKRRSVKASLLSVPEGTTMPSSTLKPDYLSPVPPRKESLQAVEGAPRPRLGGDRSVTKSKRRSASLSDIFKGGFSPSQALNGLPASDSYSSTEAPRPINAAHAIKNRNAHNRSGSAGSGSGSSYEGPIRTTSNASPLNPAVAYQYVNAEVDGDQPSSWLVRPSPQPHSTLSVTPPSAAVAVSSAPSRIGGIIAPALPPRKKGPSPEFGGYASAGESSGAESSYGSRRSALKNNIKGRLAALAGASSTQSPQARPKQSLPHPPGSYHPPPTSSSAASPSTPSSSTPLSPADSTQTAYTRLRSNSSHASPASTTPATSPTPNPKRMTTQIGRLPQQPSPPQSQPAQNYAQATSYAANIATTAGSLGVAAGGLAFNLGKRGWDRMGNFLGHRAGQSGNWGGLAGYASSSEGHGRESIETGAMSDGNAVYGRKNAGTRMLGTMARPPLRRGQGAVFGRRLEDCVRETRIGARNSPVSQNGAEPSRGGGVWVTALVTRCVDHIMHWGMEEEGLFRITGRSTHVNKIRSEFDNGADYVLKEAHPSDLDPHSVSSVLKAYLRELPEPILTRPLAPMFDTAITLGTNNGAVSGIGFTSFGGGGGPAAQFNETGFDLPTAEAMLELKNLMGRLPKENYDLLHVISQLLRVTAGNSKTTKMPLSNLLLVFCPSLQLSPSFLKIVIEKQDYLFGNGDMGRVAASVVAEDTVLVPIMNSIAPPLPSTPRPRLQQATPADDSKRNRTTSIFLQPGFSFTVEAYSESSTSRPLDQIPSRSVTPSSLKVSEPMPGTPSSSSGSNSQTRLPLNGVTPIQTSSIRSRNQSATKRQPSLASLFSSKPTTPVISGPIPMRPETPIDPPTLDVHVPDGSFSLEASPEVEDRTSSPLRPTESPLTCDSENFKLVETPQSDSSPVPRPAGPQNVHYSPPPQLTLFSSPPRQSGDDWASSVLMAAGGSK